MAKIDKYSIKDLKKEFGTDEACLNFLFDASHSRACSCGGEYHLIKGRRQFQCSKCRFQIAPMSGTIFEKSTSPLTSWFHALFVFSNAKSGVSAKELERQLGCTYKTAWRMLTLIRGALKQDTNKLSGNVEMDEYFFGGKGCGGRNNEELGKAMKKKSVIIGAVERNGLAKVEVVKDATAQSIGKFLYKNIERKKTQLLTDASNRYHKVSKGYDRYSVNHSAGEFAYYGIHINSIEGFFSHLQRSIKGTYKAISKKYLQSYLDAFVFHYNNRSNDKDRFSALLSCLAR